MRQAADQAEGFVHEALFYDSDDTFLSHVIPFVREGVERGEVVLVDVGERLQAGVEDVFAGEDLVRFQPGSAYLTPALAIDHYQRTIDRALAAGVEAVRAVGVVDYETDPSAWRDWIRYEAVINEVLAPYPLYGLCPYDTRRLPAEVVASARLSHPNTTTPTGRASNAEYVDPVRLLQRPDLTPQAHPIEEAPPTLDLHEADDLLKLRMDLHLALIDALPQHGRVVDFISAVSEVAANAERHGKPPVRVRVWRTPERLFARVDDQGPGIKDPMAGFGRPHRSAEDPKGLGLWAARQLCDLLDYSTTAAGFSVRLAVLG